MIRPLARGCAAPVVCALLFLSPSLAAKRPISHSDYNSWHSILSPSLSRDGKFAAYVLFPQQGNGELVVRETGSGREWRAPVGQQPPPARPNPTSDAASKPRTVTLAFVNRGKAIVFTTFPPSEAVEASRRDKKIPPKNGLSILDLTNGKLVHIDNVRGFAAPEWAGSFFIYAKEPAEKQKAGDLVLRGFDGVERVLAQTTVYTLSKDGQSLIYTTDTAVEDLEVGSAAPKMIQSGRAKYSKLTWSEDQKQLAFTGALDKSAATIFVWMRGSAHAAAVANESAPGWEKDFAPSDNGPLAFSTDGRMLFFGCAPRREETPADNGAQAATFDLWTSKDDYIQPMQHVRAQQDYLRTYRAVWHADSGKVIQLADLSLQQIIPAERSHEALGEDDRAYRAEVEYGERYSDAYAVNLDTGERHLIAKRHLGRLLLSPDGSHALLFANGNWESISLSADSLSNGQVVNLTAALRAKFFDEEHDSPSTPPPYGAAGWTSDSRYALLYDRFDIWRVAAGGGAPTMITGGAGRARHVEFRYVKLDEQEKSIDPRETFTHSWGRYRNP